MAATYPYTQLTRLESIRGETVQHLYPGNDDHYAIDVSTLHLFLTQLRLIIGKLCLNMNGWLFQCGLFPHPGAGVLRCMSVVSIPND